MPIIAGTPSVMKQANRILIRDLILANPMITKPQLAEKASLSLVTVGKVVDELLESGEITSTGTGRSTGGRKAMRYSINEDHGLVLSVLIRENRFHLSLLNILGEEVRASTCPCEGDWTEELCYSIGRLMREEKKRSVLSIGAAVPGTVHRGVTSNIPTIPQWENFHLSEHLRKEFGLPVVVENDINASTIGLHQSYSSDDVKNMVFLHLHQGIGAGVVIRDQLYRSRREFAGELSYMNIGGYGETGNLEQLVTGLRQQGDLTSIVDIVARLLVNTACLLDPDLVVIDSSYLGEEHVDPIARRFQSLLKADYLPRIVITCLDAAMYHKGMHSLCQGKTQSTVHIHS